MAWNLAQAKEHLAEIVDRAHSEGPQPLTIEGRDAFIITAQEYHRLTAAAPGGSVNEAPATPGASDI